MNQNEFKIGSKVIIVGINEFEIGGIHNFCTDIYLKDVFGQSIKYDRCFLCQIEGEILAIGKYNMYLIKSTDYKKYIFSNDYNEMRLKDNDR